MNALGFLTRTDKGSKNTYEVCAALHQRGYDIEVLTKCLGRRGDDYDEKIRDLGIPIHRRLPIWLGRLRSVVKQAQGDYHPPQIP